MAVVSMLSGSPTPDGVTFTAKVDTGPVRVAVSTDSGMSSPVFTSSGAVDADGVATVAITGLQPSTRHWWQVEDSSVLDTSVTGQFVTLPAAGSAASFTVALIGDAGLNPDHPGVAGGELDNTRVSNSPTFDLIRQRALNEGWVGICHLGDAFYYNFGVDYTASVANYRRAWDDNLGQPNQGRLLRELSLLSYAYDDHDFDGGNSDGTFTDKDNCVQVVRERMPLTFVESSGAIYRAFAIGRVLFISSDTRYHRTPNSATDDASKTMLGSAQKSWLASLLASTDAKAIVWLMPTPWLGLAADTWAGFSTERAELVGVVEDADQAKRLTMVNADIHAIGGSTSGGNPHGRWPILLCASVDANPSPSPGSQYDLGFQGGRDQYGTLSVSDRGNHILVTISGWHQSTEVISHTFAIAVDAPATQARAEVAEFAEFLSGSHDVVSQARVLTSFQSGDDDPDGTSIPILGGDVQYDATAEVFASLALDLPGVDETTGRSWFPRLATDLLAPYGNEIFVRRGVDAAGGGILWSPLGIFRIESVEQAGPDSESPIRIAGRDRMGGIVEAELLSPREYLPSHTFAAIFADLVGDVYPDAVIVFDDSSALSAIGRRLVVDESRYDPLLEMADALGKVMYFDGEGVLRVEDPPADDDAVWRIAAGRGGVLLSSARRVSRDGAFNAVIVQGEGGGGEDPVRGVAVDSGPRSATRFGGRFGRVPRVETLPHVTTAAQASAAARQILRRNLGAPFSADFSAVANPALRPRMPVLIVQRDGNRETHVIETLTIPLTADGEMSGTTRERTHIVIGSEV